MSRSVPWVAGTRLVFCARPGPGPVLCGDTGSLYNSGVTDEKEPRVGPCLFCDEVGELTDEDLFSIWINKALTDRSGKTPKIAFSSRRVDGDEFQNLARKLNQTYSVIKIPDICKSCNNGWMSVIDNEASKIIKPMLVEGRRFGLPVREQSVLGRWLALKTLLADLIDDQNCVFLHHDFHAFYADRDPPPRFRASLAYIDTQGEDINLFNVQPLEASQAINGINVGDLVAVEFRFSIAPVYFHTGMVSLDGQKYPDPIYIERNPHWSPIWPAQSSEAQWPPPYAFTPDKLPKAETDWPDHEEWVKRLQGRTKGKV